MAYTEIVAEDDIEYYIGIQYCRGIDTTSNTKAQGPHMLVFDCTCVFQESGILLHEAAYRTVSLHALSNYHDKSDDED